ncbi:hypothetical protein [Alloactinosynnema sp. L-07]|nr:hypothetical protein [Alloactinosynnema sp. L-07]
MAAASAGTPLRPFRTAGFDVEEPDRFSFAPLPRGPTHAHLLGRARVPR